MSIDRLFLAASNTVLFLCGFAILASVAVRFMEPEHPGKCRRCPVATYSMIAFFLVLAALLQMRLGAFPLPPAGRALYFISGALLCAWSAMENIRAREHIGPFWSDHIVIRDGHEIIMDGPYARARHPMYGTLILFGVGLSLLYANPLVLLLLLGVFLPMMLWRSGAEEEELSRLGRPEYPRYLAEVPRLFPRLSWREDAVFRVVGLILFAAGLLVCRMDAPAIVLLTGYHLLASFMLREAKARFAYRNRVLFLPLLYGLTKISHSFAIGYPILLALGIYGMFFNCPCMAVYEKYGRCPCWDALLCCVRKGGGRGE